MHAPKITFDYNYIYYNLVETLTKELYGSSTKLFNQHRS